MKWKEDLIRDIRLGDYRDDLDFPFHEEKYVFGNTGLPDYVERPKPDFSQENQASLLKQFNTIRNTCKCIVEIGVSRDTKFYRTSTYVFLNNKRSDCVYLGVDIEDKTYLNNADENIHTIQTGSENISKVVSRLKKLGQKQIDFLFIDGWHSINQVLTEWEYTKYLSPNGIVCLHDTAYHPGPYFLINNIDRKKFHVIPNDCEDIKEDYGIGYVWKI